MSPLATVTLRQFTISDVDNLMEWMSDDRVSRDTSWYTCKTKQECLDYLTNTIIPHPYFKAICLDHAPVGFIFIKPGNGNKRCTAELGYSIVRKHWGRGIATMAVKMVVATVFEEWPWLKRLEALVVVENPASERVLEKVGFVKEGVLRRYYEMKERLWDMTVYSYLSPSSY